MTEIKLNAWRWGVVPELHPEAVVFPGGHNQDCIEDDTRPVRYRTLVETYSERKPRWYAVLSLGPPAMPEPELRLPEGWEVSADRRFNSDEWAMEASAKNGGSIRGRVQWFGKSRRECVEEINRILGGGK